MAGKQSSCPVAALFSFEGCAGITHLWAWFKWISLEGDPKNKYSPGYFHMVQFHL